MLRKYSAILFLVVAQIVILGHGIVSHHHHADIVNDGHHNGKNSHHKDSKETPLELAFSVLYTLANTFLLPILTKQELSYQRTM
jgi:hypothetical protein